MPRQYSLEGRRWGIFYGVKLGILIGQNEKDKIDAALAAPTVLKLAQALGIDPRSSFDETIREYEELYKVKF